MPWNSKVDRMAEAGSKEERNEVDVKEVMGLGERVGGRLHKTL